MLALDFSTRTCVQPMDALMPDRRVAVGRHEMLSEPYRG
jgi:hypothetical protein